MRDEVAVIRPPAWHRFPHAFSHIFAGGLRRAIIAIYAELLAADGFRRLPEAGLVDRKTGDRFPRGSARAGATRPAADASARSVGVIGPAVLVRHGLQ